MPERDAATSPETATWSTHAVDADAGLRPSTDLLAVEIPVDGALSSVSAFFQSLAATQTTDPEGAGLLAPYGANLASSLLAYAARTRGVQDLSLLLQRERALAYLRHHLGYPDLDVDRIAVGCHVCPAALCTDCSRAPDKP